MSNSANVVELHDPYHAPDARLVIIRDRVSRSYDATLRAVRFWGHDSAMETSFFVNEESLKRIQPDMRSDEAGLLSAFDSHRDLIHATASKLYKRSRKSSYELSPDDF